MLVRIVEASSTPQTAGPPAPSLKGETTVEEPDRAGRAIARRSAEIRATVPDLELAIDAGADGLLARAETQGASTGALLVSACAQALREFPRVNGHCRDGRYERYSRVNVGLMIRTEDAQTTATLLDADTKSPAELDEEMARLAARARSGELTPPEQAGAPLPLAALGA